MPNDDLADACFELARTAKWIQKPIDAAEITALAKRFKEVATLHVSDGFIDEAVITRAVRYITQAHGMPIGDDTDWFEHMLQALLEVARPNSGLDQSGREFLADMIDGIQSSMSED
jgi:hypothetical protein